MKNQTGIISDVRYVPMGTGKICEVKVKVDGRDTNWLPKASVTGGSHKVFVPPRVGDQVIVHNENGLEEDGYVTDNIAFEKVPQHEEISENKIIMWSEDGTTYVHDIKDKIISLTTPCEIIVEAEKDVTIKAPNVIIDSNLKVNGTIDDIGGSLTTHLNGPYPRIMEGPSND